MCKHLKKWVVCVLCLLCIVIVSSAISVLSVIRFSESMCYEAISTGIVLTFVGILATFVVVSNYAQVKETGDRVTKLEGQVNKLSAEMTLNDAKLRGEIISAMSESPEEFQKYISRMLELRKKGKKDSPNQSKDNE